MNARSMTSYTISIVMLVLGGILVIAPGTTTILICRIIGIAMLAGAITSIFFSTREKDAPLFKGAALSGGAIAGIVGVFFLIRPDFVVSLIPFAVGIAIFINGVINVMQAMEIGRAGGDHVIHLIIGIATAALGILIFTNPFGTLTLTLRVIGIVLVADALTNIFTTRTYYTQI